MRNSTKAEAKIQANRDDPEPGDLDTSILTMEVDGDVDDDSEHSESTDGSGEETEATNGPSRRAEQARKIMATGIATFDSSYPHAFIAALAREAAPQGQSCDVIGCQTMASQQCLDCNHPRPAWLCSSCSEQRHANIWHRIRSFAADGTFVDGEAKALELPRVDVGVRPACCTAECTWSRCTFNVVDLRTLLHVRSRLSDVSGGARRVVCDTCERGEHITAALLQQGLFPLFPSQKALLLTWDFACLCSEVSPRCQGGPRLVIL